MTPAQISVIVFLSSASFALLQVGIYHLAMRLADKMNKVGGYIWSINFVLFSFTGFIVALNL